uniref:Piwi domain-containing protein n=1 Tax=Caenorhabditis tropicalis TaxID=1561998 RepID=A0A1I7U6W7_9PELO
MKIITSKIWEAYCRNNPYLKSFGIKVNEKPIELEAKVIYPAELVYDRKVFCQRDDETFQFLPPNKTKFFKPAEVQKIVVINFDDAIENPDDLKTFCEKLYTKCSDNGMTMTTQPDTWTRLSLPSEEIGKLELRMRDFKRQNVTIIIGVTKEKKPTVHDVLKYFEATLGIPTLHIHIDTAKHFINERGDAKTVKNVIRKLNPKCGGINFIVQLMEFYKANRIVPCSVKPVSEILFEETQFIAFEMIHEFAGPLFNQSQRTFDEEPTFVGCSYSLELATDLGGFNYLQEFNQYKLKNVKSKLEECLNHYNTAVGRFPKTVVVFRTGSEDELDRVREEIVHMKKALEDKNIKLIVLIVEKTSHFRIFPTGAQQNVISGTVIDDTITTPDFYQFYLVSQTVDKGTARPIKYTVAVNDPGWKFNVLYNLTYFLACGHQVSYQSPAVPNVVYAAENLAKRCRNNFLTHRKLGKLETTITRVLANYDDLNERKHDKELDGHMVDEISRVLNENALKRRNFWA